MKKAMSAILVLFSFTAPAQLQSEVAYYFEEEIDTLLKQLSARRFKTLDILIETEMHYPLYPKNYFERKVCTFKNDSILELVEYFRADSGGLVDSAYNLWNSSTGRFIYPPPPKPAPYSLSNPKYVRISRKKDSLGYVVRYDMTVTCNPEDTLEYLDTVSRSYTREKYDELKRLTYTMSCSNFNESFEIIFKYNKDGSTTEKRYETENGRRSLRYIYREKKEVNWLDNIKTVTETSKGKYYSEAGAEREVSVKTKNIHYAHNGRIQFVDFTHRYPTAAGKGFSVKMTVKTQD